MVILNQMINVMRVRSEVLKSFDTVGKGGSTSQYKKKITTTRIIEP
jgi:hypothetical protein